METIVHEWLGLVLRWLHLVAGMAWIGSSFYFMHIDASLKPSAEIPAGKGGEAWEVHGGGFYRVQKYLVAPARLPEHLIWHKWQSYTTWASGFLLLVWVYYLGASLYLIDPAVMTLSPAWAAAIGIAVLIAGWIVYDLLCRSPLGANDTRLAAAGFVVVVAAAYGLQSVFSGKGALMHTGALMATWMTGNVAHVIIPNQRTVITELLAGRAPDPALGAQAKQRSSHNNYLTLPVVFLMLSAHYPLTFSSRYSFVIVALALIAGALIRHFYNARHAGTGDPWWTWAVAAAAMLLAAGVSMTGTPAGRALLGLAEAPAAEATTAATAAPQQVADVIIGRCSMCHGSEPYYDGVGMAPKGLMLDTPERVALARDSVRLHAALTRSMPPGNVTDMTEDERALLVQWTSERHTKMQAD